MASVENVTVIRTNTGGARKAFSALMTLACFAVFLATVSLFAGCSRGEKKVPEGPDINLPLGELKPEEPEPEKVSDIEPFNVLLAGVDRGKSADTVMVVHVSYPTKSVNVVSIPRDTRVEVQGYKSRQRINRAYRKGAGALVQSAESLLGVEIKYYIIVDLASAEKVIDSVGGLDIEVEKGLRYTDRAQGLYIDINGGMQHLDGQKALHYARFRSDRQGDRGRVVRQQKLLKAFLAKVASVEIIPRLPELIKTLIETPLVKTNLSLTDAIKLAKEYDGELGKNVSAITVSSDESSIESVRNTMFKD